jgi:hypothetical protein
LSGRGDSRHPPLIRDEEGFKGRTGGVAAVKFKFFA